MLAVRLIGVLALVALNGFFCGDRVFARRRATVTRAATRREGKRRGPRR